MNNNEADKQLWENFFLSRIGWTSDICAKFAIIMIKNNYGRLVRLRNHLKRDQNKLQTMGFPNDEAQELISFLEFHPDFELSELSSTSDISRSAQPTSSQRSDSHSQSERIYEENLENGVSKNYANDTYEVFGKSADLVLSLLRWYYGSSFSDRPQSGSACLHWLNAVLYREQRDHANAKKCVESALQEENWLPFVYACLWNYTPSSGNLTVRRIEYEAMHAILQALEKEGSCIVNGVDLSQVVHEVKMSVSDPEDSHRFSTLLKKDKETQCDGTKDCCHHLPFNRILCSSLHQSNDRDVRLNENMSEWDHLIIFYCAQKWPALIISSADPTEITVGFFAKSDPLSKKTYSDCFPESFKTLLYRISGQSGQRTSKLTLWQVFYNVCSARSHHNAHRGGLFLPFYDFWMASESIISLSFMLMAHLNNVSANPASFFPRMANTSDLIMRCSENIRFVEKKLTDKLSSIPSTNKDFEETFMELVNNLERDGPILILLVPPLPMHMIPSSLLAIPWTLVVDFNDEGKNDGKDSNCWKSFSQYEKLNQNLLFRSSPNGLENGVLNNGSRIGVPFWQPLNGSNLDGAFSANGVLNQNSTECKELKNICFNIQSMCGYLKHFSKGKNVHVFIPLYEKYSQLSKPAEFSSWSTGYHNRTFAIPLLMEEFLNEIERINNFANFRVVVLTENSVPGIENFVSGVNRLGSNRKIRKFNISPDILRIKLQHAKNHNQASADMSIQVYSNGTPVAVPFVASEELESQSSEYVVGKSHENLRALNDCGFDLLHFSIGTLAFKKLTESTLWSNMLRDNTAKAIVSPQAFAIMSFYYGHILNWAVFDSTIISKDIRLSKIVDFIVPFDRKIVTNFENLVNKLLFDPTTKAKLSDITALRVSYTERSGVTTFLRQFAWQAFSSFYATVIWLDSASNNVSMCLDHVVGVLRSCVGSNSPIVFIADRNIMNSTVESLVGSLCRNQLTALIIRVMKNSTDGGGLHTVNKNEPFTLTGLNKNVAENVFRAMLRFESIHNSSNYQDVNIRTFVTRVSDQKKSPFNRLMYFGLLDFAKRSKSDALGKTNNSNHSNIVSHFDILHKTMLHNITHAVVELLCCKIKQSTNNSLSVASLSTGLAAATDDGDATISNPSFDSQTCPEMAVFRCLCYLAIVQLCSKEFTGINSTSFSVVLNDMDSHQWLFKSWNEKKVEANVLRASYNTFAAKKYTILATSIERLKTSLLPFSIVSNALTDLNGHLAGERSTLENLSSVSDMFKIASEEVNKVTNEMKQETSNFAHQTIFSSGNIDYRGDLTRLFVDCLNLGTLKNGKATEKVCKEIELEEDIFSTLIWDDILIKENGRIRFWTEEMAEVFLAYALLKEHEQHPNSLSMKPILPSEPMEIEKSVPAHFYYVAALSLFSSILKDNDDRTAIENDLKDCHFECSLAWSSRNILISKQHYLARSSAANNNSGRMWPWLVAKIKDSVSYESITTVFSSVVSKLFVASMALFCNNWRVSTNLAFGLTDFHISELLHSLNSKEAELDKTSPDRLSELDRFVEKTFNTATKMFLHATGRLLMSLDEIPLKIEYSSRSSVINVDVKKFVGTFTMLGQSMTNLVSVCLHSIRLRIKIQNQILIQYGDRTQKNNIFTMGMDTLSFMIAAASVAQKLFRLSLHIQRDKSTPLADSNKESNELGVYGDELEAWLGVLEFANFLRHQFALPDLTSLTIDEVKVIGYMSDIYDVSSLGKFSFTKLPESRLDSVFDISNYYFLSESVSTSIKDIIMAVDTGLHHFNYMNMITWKETESAEKMGLAYRREERLNVKFLQCQVDGNQTWEDLFQKAKIDLDSQQHNENASEVAFLKRRVGIYASYMWKYMGAQVNHRENNSRQLHEQLLNEGQQANIVYVLMCIKDCMTALTPQYHYRLMMQYFELTAYVQLDSLQILDHTRYGEYGGLTIAHLQEICDKWNAVTTQTPKIDFISRLSAQRYCAILAFLWVWANTTQFDVSGQEIELNIQRRGYIKSWRFLDDKINILRSLNGYVDSYNAHGSQWFDGELNKEKSPAFIRLDRFVLIKPMCGYGAWGVLQDNPQARVEPRWCLRRKFGEKDEERFESVQTLQTICGRLVKLFSESNDKVRGVVKIRNCDIYLFFSQPSNPSTNPILLQDCTFNVEFAPDSIRAFNVRNGNNPVRVAAVPALVKTDTDNLVPDIFRKIGSALPPDCKQHFIDLEQSENALWRLSPSRFFNLARFSPDFGTPLHFLNKTFFDEVTGKPKLQSLLYAVKGRSWQYDRNRGHFSNRIVAFPIDREENSAFASVLPWKNESLMKTYPVSTSQYDHMKLYCLWENLCNFSLKDFQFEKDNSSAHALTDLPLIRSKHKETPYNYVYLLISLSTRGLLAVREGLIVLIVNGSAKNVDMGILAFESAMFSTITSRLIMAMWTETNTVLKETFPSDLLPKIINKPTICTTEIPQPQQQQNRRTVIGSNNNHNNNNYSSNNNSNKNGKNK